LRRGAASTPALESQRAEKKWLAGGTGGVVFQGHMATPTKEKGFMEVFERSATPMMLADDSRQYRDANPAACDLLGVTREQATSLRIDDLTAPEHRPGQDERWRKFMAEGTMSGRITLVAPDGRRLPVVMSGTANVLPGLHLGVFQDADTADVLDEADADDPGATREDGRSQALTPREREVMTLLALGLSGAEIAERLELSPETVRIHVRNARQHLGAKTRAHAIALALKAGEINF
jgi:PAS domain S-box-containing protein